MRAIASPRSGCRGTITVSSDGKNPASVRCASSRISSSPGWVDAATMIGRPRVTAISRSSLAGSAGGAGTSSFRFPVVTTLRLPSAAKRSASTCRLGEADLELAEQCRDRAAHPAPARKRALRHPAVDQHHRQPPRRARQDQIGPQIGFDEQRQRRPPVIEKARDIARRIVRHILMDDVGGKPLGDDRRRGHRARRQQDADIQRAQSFDQGGRRQHLADAGAVNPDQRPVRPDIRAHAAALADPRRILLALLQPPLDQRRRQRQHRRGQLPVDAQRHRQGVSQCPPPDGRPSHRRGGSLRSGWSRAGGGTFPWSRHRHPAARSPRRRPSLHRARMAN